MRSRSATSEHAAKIHPLTRDYMRTLAGMQREEPSLAAPQGTAFAGRCLTREQNGSERSMKFAGRLDLRASKTRVRKCSLGREALVDLGAVCRSSPIQVLG